MNFTSSTMSSCLSSSMGASASSMPWSSAESLLEASIPGFSIVSSLAKNYLRLDVSALISALLPIAAAIAAVRYSYGPLSTYLLKYGISTAEIRNDDETYNYIMFWISQQRFAATNPSFKAGTRTSSELVYDNYDEGDNEVVGDEEADLILAQESFEKYWAQTTARDKVRTIYFTPCDGTHYFKFRGHYLSFHRETTESTVGRFSESREVLQISCLGRDGSILKELLKEAQKMYIARDSTKTVIYRKESDCDDWQRCMARPPRPLSTVVLDPKLKNELVEDVKEYLHPLTKRWYANRGIPYRRGYLLYGPPGTGKTSLCVALAGMFDLDVYVTSLNSKTLTEDGLATMFGYLPDRCVVLLEDVDSAGITHKRDGDTAPTIQTEKDRAQEAAEIAAGVSRPSNSTSNNAGISLSGLLNVIDGVASSEGRILIMTTNHVEKLDPALLRPGRVDMSIAFENATTATAKELFRSTYISREEDYPMSRKGDNKEAKRLFPKKFDHSDEQILEMATQFAAHVPSGEFSPAAIQGYLLKHKATPQMAADGVVEWIVKIREEKDRQRRPDGTVSKRSETPVLVENVL